MTRLRPAFFLQFVFSVLLLGALGGCLPETFSTAPAGPTRANNTWLLGVWEAPRAEGGGVFRAVVTPKSGNRSLLFLEERDAEGRVIKSASFESWITKVGQATLIAAKCLDGEKAGRYVVFGYQLLDPLNVRIRALNLPAEAFEATSFTLRKAIRRAFKDGTLFQGDDLIWKKTGEIYWNPEGNPEADTFTPPRYLPPISTDEPQFQVPPGEFAPEPTERPTL